MIQTIDPVVLKETKYIAVWALIFSAIMQAVFLVIGLWDYTVLLGNVLSVFAVVGNFFAMALAVQRAVAKDEKEAKQTIRVSNAVRMFAMFAVLVVGVLVPVFNVWTVIIPFAFPRLIVAIRPTMEHLLTKKEGTHEK